MTIKDKIRTIIDHPKPGVLFRDITTLLKEPAGFQLVINNLVQRYQASDLQFDNIAGIEARGFVIGGALAYALGKGLILIRKPGKLPAQVISESYQLEYGNDSLEMHADAVLPGQRIVLIDDLLATGGTLLAAIQLIEKLGGIVVGCAVVINLAELGGAQLLQSRGYSINYLTEF